MNCRQCQDYITAAAETTYQTLATAYEFVAAPFKYAAEQSATQPAYALATTDNSSYTFRPVDNPRLEDTYMEQRGKKSSGSGRKHTAAGHETAKPSERSPSQITDETIRERVRKLRRRKRKRKK